MGKVNKNSRNIKKNYYEEKQKKRLNHEELEGHEVKKIQKKKWMIITDIEVIML
ncbi:hypothetical protein KAJ27_21550 [bacterium]|nr:hypothetical protein [bacterium]